MKFCQNPTIKKLDYPRKEPCYPGGKLRTIVLCPDCEKPVAALGLSSHRKGGQCYADYEALKAIQEGYVRVTSVKGIARHERKQFLTGWHPGAIKRKGKATNQWWALKEVVETLGLTSDGFVRCAVPYYQVTIYLNCCD